MIWRKSTALSDQGSSDTLDLIERGRKRFRQNWVRLPRVAGAEAAKRTLAWQEFSKNIADHLAWESFAAVRQAQIARAASGLRTLLRLHPSALSDLVRRWTRAATITTLVSALADRKKLPHARAYFKQVRSNTPRQ